MDEITEEFRRRQAARPAKPEPKAGTPVPPELDLLIRQVAERIGPEIAQARRQATAPTAVSDTRAARVTCMMMQRDEEVVLDSWLRYHAYLFGAGNLIVLDNGSTRPAVLERLERAAADGVHVIRDFDGKPHFEDKGRVFRGLARRMERHLGHDFFMPLDCDEFVGWMGRDGRVLCTPKDVTGQLQAEHKADPRVLLIRGSFFNIPGQPGWYSFRNERKCFFAGNSIRSLSMGFHHGASRLSEEEAQTGIVHFHYRYKPYDQYVLAAKQKLEGRVDEFSADAVLASRRSGGSHMTRYAFLTEAEYAESFTKKLDRMPIFSLQDAFRGIGLELPY